MIPIKRLSAASKYLAVIFPSVTSSAWGIRNWFRHSPVHYFTALSLFLIGGCLGSFNNTEIVDKSTRVFPSIRLQGGCIAPSAPNDSIRLDVMDVTVRCKRDSYLVDADYHLFNTGETTAITVGVPKFGRTDESESDTVFIDFLGFDAWVNDRKAEFVEVRHFFTDSNTRPIGGYCHMSKASETLWMTKEVTFKGETSTKLRVRYEALYDNIHQNVGWFNEYGFYHCSTGRFWKGNIKKATFVVDTTDTRRGVGALQVAGLSAWPLTNTLGRSEEREFEPGPGSVWTTWGADLVGAWRRGTRYVPAPTPCSLEE